MLCDPAPFGRGSEGLLMGQQGRVAIFMRGGEPEGIRPTLRCYYKELPIFRRLIDVLSFLDLMP
jgi:hypothetical protein